MGSNDDKDIDISDKENKPKSVIDAPLQIDDYDYSDPFIDDSELITPILNLNKASKRNKRVKKSSSTESDNVNFDIPTDFYVYRGPIEKKVLADVLAKQRVAPLKAR